MFRRPVHSLRRPLARFFSQLSHHHNVLGVSATASKDEIRKSYLTLAKKYHPDVVSEPEKEYATIKFREIMEAYKALKDGQPVAPVAEYQPYSKPAPPRARARAPQPDFDRTNRPLTDFEVWEEIERLRREMQEENERFRGQPGFAEGKMRDRMSQELRKNAPAEGWAKSIRSAAGCVFTGLFFAWIFSGGKRRRRRKKKRSISGEISAANRSPNT